MKSELQEKNRRLGMIVLVVVFAMIGMSFAAVPLYRMFCQATGFGGTTMVSKSLPDHMVDRSITVKFNTSVGPNLLWDFTPEQRQIDVKLGQKGLMAFDAHNKGQSALTGVAVYGVTPPKAGKYFHKIQCFCFGEQSLNPGEKVVWPVIFYIDPTLNDDPNMQDVDTITLSYSFLLSGTVELDRAMEDFYAGAKTAGTVALSPQNK